MTIGEKITQLLNEKNITAKELSIKSGICNQTITNWKKGKIKKPRIDILGKIAKALNCDLKDFEEFF